ncbi:GNAT family N-acetyltransferase [Sporolactobacillus pectinivorans]|uniref:GNAT family N-acetyltransferase n=1 Tax=Sporolactobacillus pectinivorans TaxID=1591408 RepID=UPI000C25B5E1|nr:GNAT family N-acetyltransferase [Sporolactobacillus pectinivorans]
MEKDLKQVGLRAFDDVYELMKQSFPANEIRSYNQAKKLLEKPNYRVLVISEHDLNIGGFIAEWKFDKFRFIEHLATDPRIRGLGLGSKMMKSYLAHTDQPIVLEVETPVTELAVRRVHFYQRLGFAVSNFGYFQPDMQGTSTQPVSLKIMAYPDKITETDFKMFRKEIFQNVYGLAAESLATEYMNR